MNDVVQRLQKDTPIDYLVSIVSITLALMFAISLSASALFLLTSLDNTRCWQAVGESFDAGFSSVQMSTGLGVGGSGFVDFAIEYVLPAAEGSLARVQLHGPIVLGSDPAYTPVALTLCGDAVACVDMETETCLRENRPVGCGRIASKVRQLGPHDTPVEPNGYVVQLSEMLEEHPQRFYINVTSAASPNGVHRGFIGVLCRL